MNRPIKIDHRGEGFEGVGLSAHVILPRKNMNLGNRP